MRRLHGGAEIRARRAMRQERNISDLLDLPRFIVCGANSGGDQVHDWLRAQGKQVLAFTDANESLRGGMRRGLPVLCPADAVNHGDAATGFAIGTIRQRETAELLTNKFAVSLSRVFPFVNPMFAKHFESGALKHFLNTLYSTVAIRRAEMRRTA